MAKKYLSLEEAAQELGISTEVLNKHREDGEIRGFADRGTWKFKMDDVEKLGRTLQTDSSPEVPLLGDDGDSIFGDDDPLGEDATVISNSDVLGKSDSDVRLVTSAKLERLSFNVTTRPANPLALARSATFSHMRQR